MRKILITTIVLVICVPILVSLWAIVFATPWKNDCVQVYAKRLQEGEKEGYIYDTLSTGLFGVRKAHIDRNLSFHEMKKPLPVIWKAYGCKFVSDNKVADYFNTVYCGVSYLIK